MPNVTGDSADPNMAGVVGTNTVNGVGIWGEAQPQGRAIVGVAQSGVGVWGATATGRAVVGAVDSTGDGVWGETQSGTGVVGVSRQGRGVSAGSQTNTGVFGESKSGRGVEGYSESNYGVYGQSNEFPGVRGTSQTGRGIEGWSTTNSGLWGLSESGAGVEATSTSNDGVRANSAQGNGVSARGGNTGIFASGPVNAGFFEGNVHVTGNISIAGDIFLQGADYAEELTAGGAPAPGTVVVLDDDGLVRPCARDHDPRVAGIVSGARGVKPALVLDRHDDGAAVALLGKAWCKADATPSPIRPGDLLTSSATVGHAQRVTHPDRVLGAVIGKALTPLAAGVGWVRVLVSGVGA